MSYKRVLKSYHNEMIKEIEKFVAIPSVYDEETKTKEMPFGKNVDLALAYVAELGEKYGFEVDRCDGYATELTIGSGNKMIGIFAHGDVVPASGKWDQDPFKCYIKDGKIFGRGTSDDKGPFIAAFFAVVALKDCDLLKDYKVRLVVGGDEERGSSCLDYYFRKLHKPYPDYGFTPDSDFPLIYGEKGISDFFAEINVDIPHIKSIKGGVATNAVCDKVEIVTDDIIALEKYCKKEHISYEIHGKILIILGKSAHGSTPEKGDNAALKTMLALGRINNIQQLIDIGSKLMDTTGKSFGGYAHSHSLGKTTYCVGMINYANGVLSFTVNFRYPETVDRTAYKLNFDNQFNVFSTLGIESPHLLYSPHTPLVRTLLKAYRRNTFDFKPPLTTGGGTYAKHAKNTIAFGALFPKRKSTMHEPNEYMPVKDIYKAANIYATAVKLLGKLK